MLNYEIDGIPARVTASIAAEDADDAAALSVIEHELGHQLGLPDLYGSCASEMFPLVPANVECIGPWDTMAFDWARTHFSSWSRFDRGWLRNDVLTGVVTRRLTSTGFTASYELAPLEDSRVGWPGAPPAVIRLSLNPRASLSSTATWWSAGAFSAVTPSLRRVSSSTASRMGGADRTSSVPMGTTICSMRLCGRVRNTHKDSLD